MTKLALGKPEQSWKTTFGGIGKALSMMIKAQIYAEKVAGTTRQLAARSGRNLQERLAYIADYTGTPLEPDDETRVELMEKITHALLHGLTTIDIDNLSPLTVRWLGHHEQIPDSMRASAAAIHWLTAAGAIELMQQLHSGTPDRAVVPSRRGWSRTLAGFTNGITTLARSEVAVFDPALGAQLGFIPAVHSIPEYQGAELDLVDEFKALVPDREIELATIFAGEALSDPRVPQIYGEVWEGPGWDYGLAGVLQLNPFLYECVRTRELNRSLQGPDPLPSN